MKQATSSILGILEDNRQFSGYYKKMPIPATPKGNQKFIFEVGQSVQSSEYSRFKNVSGKVIERYMDNGYAYYVVKFDQMKGNTTEREKDLK